MVARPHRAEAAEKTAQGQTQQAADALDKLSNELAGMQKQLEELETLDDAHNYAAWIASLKGR